MKFNFSVVIFCFSVLFSSTILNAQRILIGRTTGMLPYLEFGLGNDRLGGAKMTYLDTNVLVKVIDSVENDYKVQLSTNHVAYLPKDNFKPDTSVARPYHLTSSWRVWGDEKFDYVTVMLDEKLPYRSMQQINPSKIVVDIFGATSNTNWITQLKTVKEIRNVYYEQIEDDVFRIFIELKNKQHWGHSIYYDSNRLVIRVRQQPKSLRIRDITVAVDAGHGGTNEGAKGISTGILEKDYTFKIAQELKKYLKSKKVNVVMTRENDTSTTTQERFVMLRDTAIDILISIHLNSSGNRSVRGVSTYYRHIGFRSLTEHVLNKMLELGLPNFGNIGAFNFTLSGPTEFPNCLVEVAFLSNELDEKLILNSKFHKNVAKKIHDGIVSWLQSID